MPSHHDIEQTAITWWRRGLAWGLIIGAALTASGFLAFIALR